MGQKRQKVRQRIIPQNSGYKTRQWNSWISNEVLSFKIIRDMVRNSTNLSGEDLVEHLGSQTADCPASVCQLSC